MALELAVSIAFLGTALIFALAGIQLRNTNPAFSTTAFILMMVMIGSGFWMLGNLIQDTNGNVANLLYNMLFPFIIFAMLIMGWWVFTNFLKPADGYVDRVNRNVDAITVKTKR